jgi:hypothetical protein
MLMDGIGVVGGVRPGGNSVLILFDGDVGVWGEIRPDVEKRLMGERHGVESGDKECGEAVGT